eukprot:scaffold10615_cov106-Isochrysis_galbana.AAC.9
MARGKNVGAALLGWRARQPGETPRSEAPAATGCVGCAAGARGVGVSKPSRTPQSKPHGTHAAAFLLAWCRGISPGHTVTGLGDARARTTGTCTADAGAALATAALPAIQGRRALNVRSSPGAAPISPARVSMPAPSAGTSATPLRVEDGETVGHHHSHRM